MLDALEHEERLRRCTAVIAESLRTVARSRLSVHIARTTIQASQKAIRRSCELLRDGSAPKEEAASDARSEGDRADTERGSAPIEGAAIIAGQRTADGGSDVADEQHGREELREMGRHGWDLENDDHNAVRELSLTAARRERY